MQQRMWLISQGEYSGYQVLAACPDEGTARAVAASMNRTRHLVEYGYEEVEVGCVPVLTQPPRVVERWSYYDKGPATSQPCWDFQLEDEASPSRSGVGRTPEEAAKAFQDKQARQRAIEAEQALP